MRSCEDYPAFSLAQCSFIARTVPAFHSIVKYIFSVVDVFHQT